MTSAVIITNAYNLLKTRFFLILWISVVAYLFYDSFIYYKTGRQFYYLRLILGRGLCVSRGTATVLNLCSALVLLPVCKKLNLVLYRMLSKLWPGLFFFWLERAKSFHMTVAVTLVCFAVLHSISHFTNLWNFSRHYDEARKDVNFANYKNENPLILLVTQAGLTGVLMLAIATTMGLMSMKIIRRKLYNAFWYTHQLYIPFMMLLVIHPLSGALKEEVFDSNQSNDIEIPYNFTKTLPKFSPIQSNAWKWVAFPFFCYFVDFVWRLISRNNSKVEIIQANRMAGRTLSLTIRCDGKFRCRAGQYILLQCTDVSLLEWHPFTVVFVPTSSQRHLSVWIRVKGDWTEAFDRALKEKGFNQVSLLLDGPYSSPMERAITSGVAICVATGVGITPFVALIEQLLTYPKNRLPGRVHLVWIVRHEQEVSWLADLLNKCLLELRNSNRPDRLHVELYVTGQAQGKSKDVLTKLAMVTEKGETRILDSSEEKQSLLTPHVKRKMVNREGIDGLYDRHYSLSRDYPILGCRVRKGRPYWDRVFGYWVHIYPREHVELFCCGPKKLVQLLRKKCSNFPSSKTKFTFVHERFG